MLSLPKNGESESQSNQFNFGNEDNSTPNVPTLNSEGSSSGPIAPFKVGFADLNQDFKMPDQFRTIKKLGVGAYGKVM